MNAKVTMTTMKEYTFTIEEFHDLLRQALQTEGKVNFNLIERCEYGEHEYTTAGYKVIFTNETSDN